MDSRSGAPLDASKPVQVGYAEIAGSNRVSGAANDIKAALSSGTASEAIQKLAGNLSNDEVRALFETTDTNAVIDALAASKDAAASALGNALKRFKAGEAVDYADVVGQLRNNQVGKPLENVYMSLFQTVNKQAWDQKMAAARQVLEQNPDAASLFADNPTYADDRSQAEGDGLLFPIGDTGGVIKIIGLSEVEQSNGSHMPMFNGRILNYSGMRHLRINEHWTYVDQNGYFRVSPSPTAGEEELIFDIYDETGKKIQVKIKLVSPGYSAPATASDLVGQKHVLMFSVADYRSSDIPPLDTPQRDVDLIADILSSGYGFHVTKVANPTRQDIVDAISNLGRQLGNQDQVLVYYAGHGYQFKPNSTAFWLPSDATTADPLHWVSSADITQLLHRMAPNQIMVISDSCFSGGFVAGQTVDGGDLTWDELRVLTQRSVMMMSSGGEEPVQDGAVNSPFAKSLYDTLTQYTTPNSEHPAEFGFDLFIRIREEVIANSPQTPRYGALKEAGYDVGGDYLFFRADQRAATSANEVNEAVPGIADETTPSKIPAEKAGTPDGGDATEPSVSHDGADQPPGVPPSDGVPGADEDGADEPVGKPSLSTQLRSTGSYALTADAADLLQSLLSWFDMDKAA